MKVERVVTVLLVLFVCAVSLPVYAAEKATPAEIIQKINDAAAFLSDAGEAGLKDFSTRDSKWVWKDTYVWVLHCAEHTDAAHPIKPKLVGTRLDVIQDKAGKFFFKDFCEVAQRPNGGWVEYMWPKVNERTPSRKITYILQVPGTPYQVGAGIYDDKISVEELTNMIK